MVSVVDDIWPFSFDYWTWYGMAAGGGNCLADRHPDRIGTPEIVLGPEKIAGPHFTPWQTALPA